MKTLTVGNMILTGLIIACLGLILLIVGFVSSIASFLINFGTFMAIWFGLQCLFESALDVRKKGFNRGD